VILPAGSAPSLPYFDLLLQRLEAGDARFVEAFGRHVHWGYWPDPPQAAGSLSEFATAAERLCRLVCDAGSVVDGEAVLDAGCGFGGTVESLNGRLSGVDLVGLNIDQRQLQRASSRVVPRADNRIRWHAGDACREAFFRECARVLQPGGRLALSDFVPTPALQALLRLLGRGDGHGPAAMAATYGPIDCSCGRREYGQLARRHGFELVSDQDITRGTLPTYPLVEDLFAGIGAGDAVGATRTIAWLSRLGLLRYRVMGFRSLAGSGT
jgi:SAM-dependent methyltransferase